MKEINVNYRQKPVFKNISFHLQPGSKTAIIGLTAAGKIQLLYLLTGFIKPDSGDILFDQHDLSNYNQEALHNQVGFVFQNSIIFNMSIRENIAFNNMVTDQAMEKAIEIAELKNFIDTLPERLDTVMLERSPGILVFTALVSSWVKKKNAANLKSVGNLSGGIQENLNNFKVIIAFNRRDYFRKKFEETNSRKRQLELV